MTQENIKNTEESTELLSSKATLAEVIQAVNELAKKIEAMPVRNRGPKSERTMTEEDAFRVKFGDLKAKSHKQAAEELGLSYGQVYSCRGSYTFTHVQKDWKKA